MFLPTFVLPMCFWLDFISIVLINRRYQLISIFLQRIPVSLKMSPIQLLYYTLLIKDNLSQILVDNR